MLQTLFYIPGELFGLPVFGFGLLLAVWAVVSAVILAVQFRRGGFDANTMSYAQVLAVLGLAIYFVLPALCDPRGLPIRGYGMMMLSAVLSGMGLAIYRARRVGVDPEMIFALAFWMIIPGVLGARIVYVTQFTSCTSFSYVLLKRLALPCPPTLSIPLSLICPSQGSILFETGKSGGEQAVAAINNIIYRIFATTPCR